MLDETSSAADVGPVDEFCCWMRDGPLLLMLSIRVLNMLAMLFTLMFLRLFRLLETSLSNDSTGLMLDVFRNSLFITSFFI